MSKDQSDASREPSPLPYHPERSNSSSDAPPRAVQSSPQPTAASERPGLPPSWPSSSSFPTPLPASTPIVPSDRSRSSSSSSGRLASTSAAASEASLRVSKRPASEGRRTSSLSIKSARQRTAIACKYCRRRKIRCSGFDPTNEKSRCTNCVRFNQTCVFAPVSSSEAPMRTVSIGTPSSPEYYYHAGPPPPMPYVPTPYYPYPFHQQFYGTYVPEQPMPPPPPPQVPPTAAAPHHGVPGMYSVPYLAPTVPPIPMQQWPISEMPASSSGMQFDNPQPQGSIPQPTYYVAPPAAAAPQPPPQLLHQPEQARPPEEPPQTQPPEIERSKSPPSPAAPATRQSESPKQTKSRARLNISDLVND